MGLLNYFRADAETESGIRVTLKPEDPAEFKREYSVRFRQGFRIEITMRTSMFGDRSDSSFLYQPGGRMVLFQANAVAERIIDRDLLPEMQTLVSEILELDRAFITSPPSEFTDTKGTTWRRSA